MALYYHPRETIEDRVQVYREMVIFWVYIGFMVFTMALGAAFLLASGSLSTLTEVYIDVVGVIAVLVTCFMWTPQIWQVFKQKGQGALSFLMLLIQAPGAFLVVIYQVRIPVSE
jgi:PQ loop repeat